MRGENMLEKIRRCWYCGGELTTGIVESSELSGEYCSEDCLNKTEMGFKTLKKQHNKHIYIMKYVWCELMDESNR